jgi:hypothetical protein
VDRGAYIRVLVPQYCVVTRSAIEKHLGRPFRFPGELDTVMSASKLRLPKNIEPGSQFIETRRFAGGHKVSRTECDEVWNSQTHPNWKEYDLFEIGRSHLGNPGVIVGSEARFLLQGMNLALHLRHLVV